MKVKLENDRLREQLAASLRQRSSGRDRAPAPASQGAAGGSCRQAHVTPSLLPQLRGLLDVLSPSIEGHPISGTLMDRYSSGKWRRRERR